MLDAEGCRGYLATSSSRLAMRVRAEFEQLCINCTAPERLFQGLEASSRCSELRRDGPDPCRPRNDARSTHVCSRVCSSAERVPMRRARARAGATHLSAGCSSSRAAHASGAQPSARADRGQEIRNSRSSRRIWTNATLPPTCFPGDRAPRFQREPRWAARWAWRSSRALGRAAVVHTNQPKRLWPRRCARVIDPLTTWRLMHVEDEVRGARTSGD